MLVQTINLLKLIEAYQNRYKKWLLVVDEIPICNQRKHFAKISSSSDEKMLAAKVVSTAEQLTKYKLTPHAYLFQIQKLFLIMKYRQKGNLSVSEKLCIKGSIERSCFIGYLSRKTDLGLPCAGVMEKSHNELTPSTFKHAKIAH